MSSLLGVLNLTHRNGHSVDEISSLNPGEHYVIQLDLDVAGYTIHAGHQLRLALSQSHWPYSIWPSPVTPILKLHLASPPVLALPLRKRDKDAIFKDSELCNKNLGNPVEKPQTILFREIRKPSFERQVLRIK